MELPTAIASSQLTPTVLAALEDCSEESIYAPGYIQSHGIMLTLQEPDLTIGQVSETVQHFFGISAQALLGQLCEVAAFQVEYLQNMGVTATLTISLVDDKRLWGLMACHHYSPRLVAYEMRKTCEFLGQFASIKLVHQQDQELDRYRNQVKRIQDHLQQTFFREPNFIQQVLHRNAAKLLELVHAKGMAIVLNQHLSLIGKTPSLEDVQALLTWLPEVYGQGMHLTHCLACAYPPARAFKDTASGILAISITLRQQSYHLLWVRPEQIQTVNWAGSPQGLPLFNRQWRSTEHLENTQADHNFLPYNEELIGLQLEVEDTGCGIATSELESIFEAFMQTEHGRHTQGTGLGLSISRQFVRLMGGDIRVSSGRHQVSTFTCQVLEVKAVEHEATLDLNDGALLQLIAQIPSTHEALIKALKSLVDHFQLQAIANLTRL